MRPSAPFTISSAPSRRAWARARSQARREGAELIVKGADGRIQQRDSHGHDSRSIKG
jgi:hypothetical protein